MKKAATTAGSGQQNRVGLTLPATDAERFLRLLGKDPARTWFRTIPRGKGSNRRRSGRDLQGFDAAALEADNKTGEAIYFITGDADQATGKDKETGEPTGCVCDADVHNCRAVFVEWDKRPIEWQLTAWQELKLPEPTAMAFTGGKSIHCYWLLNEPMAPEQWKPLQERLIKYAQGDSRCKNPSRLMRLPGFRYVDKSSGEVTDRVAELIHQADVTYSAAEIEACLPAPKPTPPSAPLLRPLTADLPLRGIEAIRDAVAVLPPRQKDGGTYDQDRNAICGCSAALAEAGVADPDAEAIRLMAHLWEHGEGQASQILRSTTTRNAASFWAIAGEHGFDLKRHDLKRNHPQPPPPTKTRTPKRSLRRLSYTRSMACFERCVQIQAKRERNSLRRRARLLKAAKDLGLSSYVKAPDIAQRVLEAKDHHQGNCFRPLSAADRAAMPKPMVRWLLPDLLPARDLSIIGGRPKVGKTRLAIAMAAAVLNGKAFLELPAPVSPHTVLLVTDDQADGDTAQMLEALDLWHHPQLIWSRNFRLTEGDIDALLLAIKANPEALVVLDSLRSISRSLQHGENDPEIGATLYDLKQAVIDSGGTLLLIHHCNKAADQVGTEALSGHNAIAGAANTVITLHYLPGENGQPNKAAPERRLVREARSGNGLDLVVTPSGNSFRKVSTLSEWQQQIKAASKRDRLTELQEQVLELLQGHNDEWLTRKQITEELELPWEDRGRNKEAKRVRDALHRLVELGEVESERSGTAASYRASREAQETVLTSEPTSDGNGSRDTSAVVDSVDNGDKPSDQRTLSTLSRSGVDTENHCGDWQARLSPLSPPAQVGSGADAFADEDDPAWGPRPEVA